MATIPHDDKPAVISFRCDPEFKTQVDLALVKRGMTLQEAGVEALARFLGVKLPQKTGHQAA